LLGSRTPTKACKRFVSRDGTEPIGLVKDGSFGKQEAVVKIHSLKIYKIKYSKEKYSF